MEDCFGVVPVVHVCLYCLICAFDVELSVIRDDLWHDQDWIGWRKFGRTLDIIFLVSSELLIGWITICWLCGIILRVLCATGCCEGPVVAPVTTTFLLEIVL